MMACVLLFQSIQHLQLSAEKGFSFGCVVGKCSAVGERVHRMTKEPLVDVLPHPFNSDEGAVERIELTFCEVRKCMSHFPDIRDSRDKRLFPNDIAGRGICCIPMQDVRSQRSGV